MRNHTAKLLLLTLLLPGLAFASSFPYEQTGKHIGDARDLEYEIEYLDPKGITTVSGAGIVYAPFVGSPTTDPETILPEAYFGDYDLYFSGQAVEFVVHIKNTGKRTYKNLRAYARQELLNIDGGAGEPFPGIDVFAWDIDELRPGEEASLGGGFVIPNFPTSGIDQTHLQILHQDDKDKKNTGPGRVIVDDPQAGIWCPLGV